MKVFGFGACMISGYPLQKEHSFYQNFINKLNIEQGEQGVESQLLSLGGFPITRVVRYVEKKILPATPDLVVMQFGSTDASVALKNAKIFKKSVKGRNNAQRKTTYFPYNDSLQIKVKNIIKVILKLILRVKPVTSEVDYIESIEEILKQLQSINTKVIVLSPFYSVDPITNHYSKKYTNLAKDSCERFGCLFVDCYHLFEGLKKEEIFLNDGFHLSIKGHYLLSEKIWEDYSHVLGAKQITGDEDGC